MVSHILQPTSQGKDEFVLNLIVLKFYKITMSFSLKYMHQAFLDYFLELEFKNKDRKKIKNSQGSMLRKTALEYAAGSKGKG